MTEHEWCNCSDPTAMLRLLQGTVSERKMRLFLVACARTVQDRITDPVMRKAVETAERYADGLVSPEEHEKAHLATYGLVSQGQLDQNASLMKVTSKVYLSLLGLSISCGFSKIGLDKISSMVCWRNGADLTGHHQPALIRDVFANPFRTIAFSKSWNSPQAIVLAQYIYDEQDYRGLSDLAIALEDAGCDNADSLNHLQIDAPHVRGCWAVDLILEKS